MGFLYNAARDIKNAIPPLRAAYGWVRYIAAKSRPHGAKLREEVGIFRDKDEVHDLPPIFHYWSNKYLRPVLEEQGFSNPHQFLAKFLHESAARTGVDHPIFLSVGAGNCDTEVRVAKLLRERGMHDFTIHCLDLNASMLRRGIEMAQREGVAAHIEVIECDFNSWKAGVSYQGIMACQSLHHVVNLEGLFGQIARGLSPGAYFIVDDMIGRNGHKRWPEALIEVRRFWRELPRSYRYNHQLGRHERTYINWDCSTAGFEGIRAQDVLPLLTESFHFHLFVGFANVIDVFIDRAFGRNYNADVEWDRAFIDRVHAFDEAALVRGALTPTHMMAVLAAEPSPSPVYSRGITPEGILETRRQRAGAFERFRLHGRHSVAQNARQNRADAR